MKKTSNRMIVVTGCFIDCPCMEYHSGEGYCSESWLCKMMDKTINDPDNWEISKWKQKAKIHPDCPLKKTPSARPKNQTYRVQDDNGEDMEDES